MSDTPDFSKEAQLARSPGGNRRCPTTGVYKGKCTCRSCVGKRSRRKGQRKQREVRKALNLKSERWKGREGNEESWTAALRVEVKGGKQVESVNRWYVKARQQSDAAKAIGDTRPFAFVAAPDGTSPLIVVRTDDLPAVVSALMEEWT